MANVMRWRYGDTSPVKLAVDAATVIEIGDLVYLDTDDVKPVSSLSYGVDLAATQEAAHDSFVNSIIMHQGGGMHELDGNSHGQEVDEVVVVEIARQQR